MQSKVKVKKQVLQKFKESYSKDFDFVLKSKNGDSFAFCRVCRRDFNISHGGKNDITKHETTQKHQSSTKGEASDAVRKTMKMDQLLTKQADLSTITMYYY